MATRADYRTDLKNKLTALVDSDAGDFDFSDTEYDIFLELSLARLFPALYVRKIQSNIATTTYGVDLAVSKATGVTKASRVYMVEDATEREALVGWEARPASAELIGIPLSNAGNARTVNIHYFDAVLMPADDVTDVGIGDEYLPLVIQGAIIEALETVQEVTPKGGQPAIPTLSAVLDRIMARYDRLKEQMAMNLPVVAQ